MSTGISMQNSAMSKKLSMSCFSFRLLIKMMSSIRNQKLHEYSAKTFYKHALSAMIHIVILSIRLFSVSFRLPFYQIHESCYVVS